MDYFESCKYSTRLIDKLISLDDENQLDISLIKKAIDFAKKYHGTQTRKSGEPYYSHPLEVAYLFSEYVKSYKKEYYTTDLIITAILHDTIEDTLATKKMIAKNFNESIASNVEDLTRIKIDHKISAGSNLELLYSQNKKDILYIKIFDRLHNMRTINFMTETKRNKIVDETIEYFVSICFTLDLAEIRQELITLSSKTKSLYKLPNFASDSNTSLTTPFSDLEL